MDTELALATQRLNAATEAVIRAQASMEPVDCDGGEDWKERRAAARQAHTEARIEEFRALRAFDLARADHTAQMHIADAVARHDSSNALYVERCELSLKQGEETNDLLRQLLANLGTQ